VSYLGFFLPLTADLAHALWALHHLPTVAASSPFSGLKELLYFLFGWLYHLLKWLLNELHTWIVPVFGSQAWGMAIIFLTIIVRLVLFPLTFKQYQGALRMQALQPKIKELQRKYKNDRALLQQETMKLYQQYRVNPFASCLPVLLQLPVFICLYYAIRYTQALKLAPFLWIPAGQVVSLHPYKFIHGLGNPDPTYILFVLYIVTQMISTELTMTPSTDPQQKWIMRAMPIFFVFILYRFPSGLFIYWVTTNLWTIGQQLIIRRTMHVELTPVPEGGQRRQGRFMSALMQAQEQRETQAGKKGPSVQPAGGKTSGAKRTGASAGGKGTKPRQGKPSGRPARGTNPPSGGGQRPPGKAAGPGKKTPPGQRPKS
jgi:YidC/Oxa1 family membrane protein insertase